MNLLLTYWTRIESDCLEARDIAEETQHDSDSREAQKMAGEVASVLPTRRELRDFRLMIEDYLNTTAASSASTPAPIASSVPEKPESTGTDEAAE